MEENKLVQGELRFIERFIDGVSERLKQLLDRDIERFYASYDIDIEEEGLLLFVIAKFNKKMMDKLQKSLEV